MDYYNLLEHTFKQSHQKHLFGEILSELIHINAENIHSLFVIINLNCQLH
jgi:hypothetical protein